MLSEEMVEKALRAVIAHQRIPLWRLSAHQCSGCDHLHGESDGPNSPRVAEHQIRAVLDAVADDLRAEAWDEGYKQGGPMHDVNYDDPDAHTRNPYRADRIGGAS